MSRPNGDERPDEDLLGLVGQGDTTALRTLVFRHLPRLLGLAERLTGNAADAEEIAQEALIRVWRAARTWKPGGARFATWLYRVTVNLCIDRRRKRKPEPLDGLPDMPSAEMGALAEVQAGQMNALVRRLLDALPEKQRIALVLSYYEELSSREVAEIMDTSPGAVMGLLFRGRQALKDRLTAAGIEGWDNEADT